jgi:hypothetical protein
MTTRLIARLEMRRSYSNPLGLSSVYTLLHTSRRVEASDKVFVSVEGAVGLIADAFGAGKERVWTIWILGS